MSSWGTTTLDTPPQPTWLPTQNTDTQGEPHQGCHTAQSSSFLHEPETPTSPVTVQSRASQTASEPMRSHATDWPHTRQGQTTPNPTTSFTRELCWSCADQVLCEPPAAGHRRRGDATIAPTPQQHGIAEEPIGHACPTSTHLLLESSSFYELISTPRCSLDSRTMLQILCSASFS
jgi:hypothetical protein